MKLIILKNKKKEATLVQNNSFEKKNTKDSFFFLFKLNSLFLFLFLIILFVYTEIKNKYIYKNYINVVYAFDNNHCYIAHVSMKSIMLSQNKTTFINFYLLVPNVTNIQKDIIETITKEHINCKIEYIELGNQFKDLRIPREIWSTVIYYRILLPDLLPKLNRILYLDTDTFVYKDLTKIYNYNLTGKYYIGMLEPWKNYYFDKYNIKMNNFLNTGVLLCNLDELRKGNISEKMKDFLNKNNEILQCPINEALNFVAHEKNEYFNEEYVTMAFCNREKAYDYSRLTKGRFNDTKVVHSYEDPYIYHIITCSKPWKKIDYYKGYACLDALTRFYEIARKTRFYHEISEKYRIKENNLKNIY